MGLTLAEKYVEDAVHQHVQTCDLEQPSQSEVATDAHGGDDALPLGLLVTAAAAVFFTTLVLWASVGIAKHSVRWLWRRWSLNQRKYAGAYDSLDADGRHWTADGLYGSPPTPPPLGWLRDADSSSPSFATPPTEPLLFSVGAPLGGAPLNQFGTRPYGVQHCGSGECATGSSGGGSGGQHLVAGHPSCDRMQLRSSGGGAGGGVGSGRGGGRPRSGGWDRGLLARHSVPPPAICSVEGLMADPAFQEYMRSTRGRSPALAREQSQAKVQLYKELRRLDPDAFRRLFSRTDIKSYDVQRPSLLLAVADYLLSTVIVPLSILAVYYRQRGPQSWPFLSYGLLVAWLLTKLWLAAGGHTSLLGRQLGVYLVYDTPDADADCGGGRGRGGGGGSKGDGSEYRNLGNAWERMAGLGGHVLLAVFELSMAVASVGLLVVGSLISILLGFRRQTLAMRLLGLRLEREVSRQTYLSPFSPVSETATPSGGTTRHTSVPYGLFS